MKAYVYTSLLAALLCLGWRAELRARLSVSASDTATTAGQLIRVERMPHIWPDPADGFKCNANVGMMDFLLTRARP